MRSRTTPLLLVLPLLLGLSACAGVVAHTGAVTSPSPTAATRPGFEDLGKGGITPHPPSSIPIPPTPVATDVAGAAAIVATRVTALSPRLLPAAVPAGMEEVVVTAEPGHYDVQYTDDTHARRIIFVSDIPLGINGPHQSLRTMQFRGQNATYVIFDTTVPTTRRQLWWNEPGSRQPPGAGPESVVGYSLITFGLTEAEFFQVADSLRPV